MMQSRDDFGNHRPYFIDVLALQLRDQLLETLVIGLDADGLEHSLDVAGRG